MGCVKSVFSVLSRVLIGIAAVMVATLLVCELVVRIVNPVPPVQVIRKSAVDWLDAGGIPVWTQTTERMNLDCADTYPEAVNLVFCGDSIFFGSGVDTGLEFTHILQDRLDAGYGAGRWCVVNLSQAGYSIEQKEYWLDRFMKGHRADHVFWEVWPNERNRFRWFGNSVYNFWEAGGDNGRLPDAIPGSGPLRDWLFAHSRFFELLGLTSLARVDFGDDWCAREYVPRLARVRDMVVGAGGTFTAVLATGLDKPFAEAMSGGRVAGGHGGEGSTPCSLTGFSTFDMAEMFSQAGVSHLDIRADECCHFNRPGHALVADMFLDIVRRLPSGHGEDPKKADK